MLPGMCVAFWFCLNQCSGLPICIVVLPYMFCFWSFCTPQCTQALWFCLNQWFFGWFLTFVLILVQIWPNILFALIFWLSIILWCIWALYGSKVVVQRNAHMLYDFSLICYFFWWFITFVLVWIHIWPTIRFSLIFWVAVIMMVPSSWIDAFLWYIWALKSVP